MIALGVYLCLHLVVVGVEAVPPPSQSSEGRRPHLVDHTTLPLLLPLHKDHPHQTPAAYLLQNEGRAATHPHPHLEVVQCSVS